MRGSLAMASNAKAVEDGAVTLVVPPKSVLRKARSYTDKQWSKVPADEPELLGDVAKRLCP